MKPFLASQYPGITFGEAVDKFAEWCQSIQRSNLVEQIVSVTLTPNAWVVDIAPFKSIPITRTQRFLVDADGVRPGGDDILHLFPPARDAEVEAIRAAAKRRSPSKTRA